MSRNGLYIGAKGGNVIGQFQFDPLINTLVTATLVQGTNCMDLGHLQSSNVALTPSVQKFPNEAGINVAQNQTWEGTITGNLMETSDEILTWVGYTTRGMKLLTYKLQGRKNAKWQEFFGVGDNDNGFSANAPDSGEGTPFKFNVTPREAVVTLTTTHIANMRLALAISQGGSAHTVPYPYVTTNVVIAKDIEFEIIET